MMTDDILYMTDDRRLIDWQVTCDTWWQMTDWQVNDDNGDDNGENDWLTVWQMID